MPELADDQRPAVFLLTWPPSGTTSWAPPGQGELFPAWRYHAVFTDSPTSSSRPRSSTAATIRCDLVTVAGRTARRGRGGLTLHLPEGWHRERGWLNPFEAACRPPAAAA